MYINIMEMLLIIGVAFVAALILAALVPLRVNFRLSTTQSTMQVRYGPFSLMSTDRQKREKKLSKKARVKKTEDKKKRKKRGFSLLGAWENFTQALRILPGFGKAALNFAGRIFTRTELSDFSGRVAGGLGDPALTGMAAGWVYSLFGALPRLGKHIAFEPDYMADWPVVEVSGKASFRPIDAALPAIQFVKEAPLAGIYRLWKLAKAKK